jgi:hypothetical protein
MVSLNERRPACASCAMATAVNILFIDPRLNLVFNAIGALVALFAIPAALLAMVTPSLATSTAPESLFSEAKEFRKLSISLATLDSGFSGPSGEGLCAIASKPAIVHEIAPAKIPLKSLMVGAI